MKGLFLFIISVLATTIVFSISTGFSLIYYVFHFWKLKTIYKKIDKYFYDMAHSVDQFANVNLQNLLNHIMIKKELRKSTQLLKGRNIYIAYHKFGDVDDTLSYIIAENALRCTLSKFGNFWAKFLNFVDRNHLRKAISNKINQDRLARERLENKWKAPRYKVYVDYFSRI